MKFSPRFTQFTPCDFVLKCISKSTLGDNDNDINGDDNDDDDNDDDECDNGNDNDIIGILLNLT